MEKKSYKQCCSEVAVKHKLGKSLVTGHLPKYWEEAAEIYANQQADNGNQNDIAGDTAIYNPTEIGDYLPSEYKIRVYAADRYPHSPITCHDFFLEGGKYLSEIAMPIIAKWKEKAECNELTRLNQRAEISELKQDNLNLKKSEGIFKSICERLEKDIKESGKRNKSLSELCERQDEAIRQSNEVWTKNDALITDLYKQIESITSEVIGFAEWIHKKGYRKINCEEILWGIGSENTNHTTSDLLSKYKDSIK